MKAVFSPPKSSTQVSIPDLLDCEYDPIDYPNDKTALTQTFTTYNAGTGEVSKAFIKKHVNTSSIEPKSLILIARGSTLIEPENTRISEKFSHNNMSA